MKRTRSGVSGYTGSSTRTWNQAGASVISGLVISGLVLLAACADSPSAGVPTIVSERDSAGITIVDNGPLDPSLDRLYDTLPRLEIGAVGGAVAEQLFRVADLGRLSTGGFAVLNGGTLELRIYEADGTHRATAGRPGEGPGEFSWPHALDILPGDTIVVTDRLDRVVFDSDGGFVRRETTNVGSVVNLASLAGGSTETGAWAADGTLVLPVYLRDLGGETAIEGRRMFRPQMIIGRATRDLSALDTLGRYGGILQQTVDVGGRFGMRSMVPPYAPMTTWAVGPDGEVVIGDNAAPEFHRFEPDGSRSIVRWSQAPRPISATDIEAWKDRQRNAEWTRGQLPELERGWAEMEVPEFKRFYGRLVVGSDGTTWLHRDEALAEPTVLWSFDAAGRYTGRVEIPGRFRPFDSGPDWLAGIWFNSDGVEFLRVYRLNDLGDRRQADGPTA